jgi:polysaccharide biosynthesis/export protein
MSRILFTVLAFVIVIPRASLRAEDPAQQGATVVGSGTLVLTGSNTYSGGTVVEEGALLVTNSNAHSGETTFSGTINGTGSLVKASGPVTLTKVGSGTLVLSDGSTHVDGTTINGLLHAGPATLTKAGTNTYTGSTTIQGGTLILGNASPNVPHAGPRTGTNTLSADTYSGGAINNALPSSNSGTTLVNPNQCGGSTNGAVYTLNLGALQTGNSAWTPATGSGTFVFDSNSATNSALALGVVGNGASPSGPIPAGPVFYIITDGAGLGDNVRCVPCTGKETVLDAIGHINGISQLSSTKIWIARPSPTSREQSTILKVDWEAISRHGINATNYTLMPGDRLVFGADPLIARSNRISKKTAVIERLDGVMGLTSSTLRGLSKLSAAERAVIKGLVQKGMFTDDVEIKHLLLDAIELGEQEGKKTAAKAVDGQKADQAAKKASITFYTAKTAGSSEPQSEGATAIATQVFREDSVIFDDSSSTYVLDSAVAKPKLATQAAPHELAMQPLPDYRIEPPDVISIEMLKMVPLPPYRAGIYDVLQIRANSLPDQPIDNYFMVEADGKVSLGPAYGSVKVAGMTIEEITAALNKSLGQWLRDPGAYVQLARVAGAQPVAGQYIVGPDGTINLRKYGRVAISGKTVAEARSAIEKQLAAYLQSPEVSVDVLAYNSKVFYIITQGAGIGDNVRRLPITGNETVLDAIAQVNGLSQVSSKNIFVVRPLASHPEKPAILPVDWDAITRRGATATNYQVLPGDRIYIAEDPLVTRTNLIGKNTAPLERMLGIISLTTSTIRGLDDSSPAAAEVVKELVGKGRITGDEEFKQILLEAIRLHDLNREKAGPKEAKKGAARP